jgi:hypothetical protein
VRVAVEPPLEVADVDVDVEVVPELLPQAAIARLATIAASASMSRSDRRGWLTGDLMVSFPDGGDQLVVVVISSVVVISRSCSSWWRSWRYRWWWCLCRRAQYWSRNRSPKWR